METTNRTATSWPEAAQLINEYAQAHGNPPQYAGTGSPIKHPCIIYTNLDALSGEGRGYFVRHYPEGEGPGKPARYFTVRITV